jgi:hypothetical protein
MMYTVVHIRKYASFTWLLRVTHILRLYSLSCMTRVAKEIQALETTFVDLDSSSDEQITASFQENTKVRIWVS